MQTIRLITGVLLFLVGRSAFAQEAKLPFSVMDPQKKISLVEASCGQCQFGLKGKGCDLAIRLNGKAYFVKGAGIDDFGEAHDEDGFCNAVRKAEVQGEVAKGKFVVSYFKLLPARELLK